MDRGADRLRTQSKDWESHSFLCLPMTSSQAAIPGQREHMELLSAFRLISADYSNLDENNEFPRSPEPRRYRGEREEFDWDEVDRIHMLYYYNWYFHSCRVELSSGTGGVVDGRPELHRQDFRRLLAEYFDGSEPWPFFVDTYYFDLEQRTLRADATTSRHIAAMNGNLPITEDGVLDDHGNPYDGLSNVVDLARASIGGFEQLRRYSYTSWITDGHHMEEYLALSGLAPFVGGWVIEWDDYGMRLFVPGVDIGIRAIEARHGSVRSFLVKQWCAVYKCCQVRVDENLGGAALLEDGRTPALRSRLDTNYMMGFFSLDPLYHPLGEPRDGVGYNPLPKELHRIQILQHRRWLESRSDASCVLYDSDEDDLFPDRDYPEREGISRIHGEWPDVTEFAQP